jgi:hypothetical protein
MICNEPSNCSRHILSPKTATTLGRENNTSERSSGEAALSVSNKHKSFKFQTAKAKLHIFLVTQPASST